MGFRMRKCFSELSVHRPEECCWARRRDGRFPLRGASPGHLVAIWEWADFSRRARIGTMKSLVCAVLNLVGISVRFVEEVIEGASSASELLAGRLLFDIRPSFINARRRARVEQLLG
jgi:hypothetical protein